MKNVKEIAEILNVNRQTIYRIIKKAKIKGETNPNKSNNVLYNEDDIKIMKSYVDSYRPNCQNSYYNNYKNHLPDAQQIKDCNLNILEDKIKYLEDLITTQKDLIDTQKLTIDLLNQKINSCQIDTNLKNDKISITKTQKQSFIKNESTKKNINDSFEKIEKFLKDKSLTVEQIISNKESEEFKITIADERLTDEERIEFKKSLSIVLEHKDYNSSWRTFKKYIKEIYLNL